MCASDVWYATLTVLADHSPMAYWHMANSSEFWWILSDRSQLLADRFTDQSFRYSEIVTVTVFREVRAGGEVFGCDWEIVRGRLAVINGLQVQLVSDLVIPPALPPNEGLRLSVAGV